MRWSNSFAGKIVAVALVTTSIWLSPAVSAGEDISADLVLKGAVCYTLDAARSWAQAIAIKNGKLIYVGSERGVAKYIGSRTRRYELSGKMVLPGFHDSHVHPIHGGLELASCNLNDVESAAAIFAAIETYARKHPDKRWVVGSGWSLAAFAPTGPTHRDLDKLIADRPAYLISQDGHSAWVNSKALQIAGITRHTADPARGRIERDASGKPSGTLRESAAELVDRFVPKVQPQEYVKALKEALKLANSCGITCLHDADAADNELAAYKLLDGLGQLTARVVAAQHFDLSKGESQLPRLIKQRCTYSTSRLKAGTVKIFADGVMESQTAAMLEPYVGTNDNRGILNLSPSDFSRVVQRLDKSGFQVHVHAIGDRAVRTALDAFQAAQNINGVRDSRHQIAHLELVDAKDVERFRQLGVVANFQPYWAFADAYITKLTEPVLGTDRSNRLYPIASMAKSGANIASGSDWPVTTINPLHAIQVAVTRCALGDAAGPAWIPEERVDLAFALAMYTISGAYANHLELKTGSLEVGKSADLIVLDRNLFAVPAGEIHKAKVLMTLLEGKEVYKDAALGTLPARSRRSK